MASYQYIYVMKNLSKTYQGGKTGDQGFNATVFARRKNWCSWTKWCGVNQHFLKLWRVSKPITKAKHGRPKCENWLLEQEPQLDNSKTCQENVLEGAADSKAILDRYNELCLDYENADPDEMAKLQDEIDAKDLWDLDRNVEKIMQVLNCPPADQGVEHLSGGEKRRIALARLIMAEPDMLFVRRTNKPFGCGICCMVTNILG